MSRAPLPCCFLHNRALLHVPLISIALQSDLLLDHHQDLLTSSSHADYTCGDPSNSSFGPLPLRHHLLNRIWTMVKFGICWFHRCIYRRGKQVLTDHYFITPAEKAQCPVHLISVKVQGNLLRCFHTQESRVKMHFPTETAFPQDIKRFKEKVKRSSGSLIRKKL